MRSIEPGIHLAWEQVSKWIPGSRYARPGMTTVATGAEGANICATAQIQGIPHLPGARKR